MLGWSSVCRIPIGAPLYDPAVAIPSSVCSTLANPDLSTPRPLLLTTYRSALTAATMTTSTATAPQFDFDDLLAMRPTPSLHPAALAINSLYFNPIMSSIGSMDPAPAPAPAPAPVPPHAHTALPHSLSQPIIPEFPGLDLFAPAASHADPVVCGALSFGTPSYSIGFPSSTISTLAHQLPSPLQHSSVSAALPTTSSAVPFGSFASAYAALPSPPAPAPAPMLARRAAPAPLPAPGPVPAPAASPSSSEQPPVRRRKSGSLTSAINKDKLEERRRKNRLSSAKCYYNRKKQIEQVEKTLQSEKRRAIALYQRELDLRNENARLKKQLVLRNIRIPSTFLTTTRTESFVRPSPVAHDI